jgi:integrase
MPTEQGDTIMGVAPRGLTKNGESRMYYLRRTAMPSITKYVETLRPELVLQAQETRLYDKIENKLIVENINHMGSESFATFRENGKKKTQRIGDLPIETRSRLYLDTEEGLEPMMLFLRLDGTPMGHYGWNKEFEAANSRVQRVNPNGPVLNPHALRHSFALRVLFEIARQLHEQGQGAAEIAVSEEAYEIVRQLLGHGNVTITKHHYSGPFRGMLAQHLIAGGGDVDVNEFINKLIRITHNTNMPRLRGAA